MPSLSLIKIGASRYRGSPCSRTYQLRKAARGRRSEHAAPHQGFGQRILAPVIVLGFCAVYLASLVRTALHLRDMV